MQLLHTLHSATSPQSSLHGKYSFCLLVEKLSLETSLEILVQASPFSRKIYLNFCLFSGTNFSSENLPHPSSLGVPYGFNNDINMERLKTDRSNGLSQSSLRADPVASFNRKRALSSSPYPDLLDVSSMIRYSPSSLYGSKNSNASGSFGHLGATALNATTSATNASIGTPMSISSLPTSIQHFLISGELLPSLSGHYISPTNSMFSLAHHQAMASSLMQMDASMQSLKSVSFKTSAIGDKFKIPSRLSYLPGIFRTTCTTKTQLVFQFKELQQKVGEQHSNCDVS